MLTYSAWKKAVNVALVELRGSNGKRRDAVAEYDRFGDPSSRELWKNGEDPREFAFFAGQCDAEILEYPGWEAALEVFEHEAMCKCPRCTQRAAAHAKNANFLKYTAAYLDKDSDPTVQWEAWDMFVGNVALPVALATFWAWQRTLPANLRSDVDPRG